MQMNAREPKPMKKAVIAAVAIVVVLAAAVGGWLWYQSKQDRGLTLYGLRLCAKLLRPPAGTVEKPHHFSKRSGKRQLVPGSGSGNAEIR